MTPEETIEALQQRGFYEGVPGEISAYSHTNTAETAEARSQQDSQALLHDFTPKAKKEKDRREAEKEGFEALSNELIVFSQFRPTNRIELLQLAVETLQRVRNLFGDRPSDYLGVIGGPTQSTSTQATQVEIYGPANPGRGGVRNSQNRKRDSTSSSTGADHV